MSLNHQDINYERQIWIELIGFDNTQPDSGAKDYLDNLGFIPDVISLLVTSPDIIHLHEGVENEVEFPADYCSYVGHARSAERARQVWTNRQLLRLVQALRAYGVKVFLSTFTMKVRSFYLPDELTLEWVEAHPELLEIKATGEANYAHAPLKRFADGSYYEDFFISKLVQTLQDYEFDGWHAADGWGPLRIPIFEGDFSDDLFDQFVQAQNIAVPAEVALQCDQLPAQLEARADWIWSTQRRQWIDFYTERWAAFYRKKAAALHELGKKIVINSAWTRDPFEAIYRYGVDYRKIIAAGVDGIVTESLAGACDMQGSGGYRLHEFSAALLLTRACVPDTKLLFLLGIKDTKEQWDVLRHAPTVFETELLTMANLYKRNEQGSLTRCADGFVGCLSDAISAEEWRWMKNRWELAFSEIPDRLLGATLVWSDAAFDHELDDFIQHRGATTHRLLHKLLEHGAAVHEVVRIENLGSATGPLLVLNAHLLPTKEMTEVLAYRNGAVFLIERQSNPDSSAQTMRCCVVEAGERKRTLIDSPPLETPEITAEPVNFLVDLPMQSLPGEFFSACVATIAEVSKTPVVVSGQEFIHVQAQEIQSGRLRLTVKNHSFAYALARIDVRLPIKSVAVLTEFPIADIEPIGTQFEIRVPGRGSVVLEVLISQQRATVVAC